MLLVYVVEPAAVNHQFLAGDESSTAAQQKRRCLRDIFTRAKSLERHPARNMGSEAFALGDLVQRFGIT